MLFISLWVFTYILYDPHHANVTLKSDPEFEMKGNEAGQACTTAATKNLTEIFFENTTAERQLLKAQQAAHEDPGDLGKIPALTRDDFGRRLR